MSTILSVWALLCLYTTAAGQTPHYFCSTWTGGSALSSDPFRAINNRYQCIYYPADFPGLPKRVITNVYLRIGRLYNTTSSVTVNNMIIRLGKTLDSGFIHVGAKDTFKTGLTTVLSVASYTFNGCDTLGKWFKMSVSGNFVYDSTKNLVFEIMHSGDPTSLTGTGFDWMANNLLTKPPFARTLEGRPDSVGSTNQNNYHFLDLGFDMSNVGVSEISNITSFGLFPNPTTDGRFNVSFDTRQAVKEARIVVTNAVGQQVFTRQYNGVGSSFFKEIDLHDAAKGIYFMELVSDGDCMVRRVVVD